MTRTSLLIVQNLSSSNHRIEINRKATRVGTFEVCVSTHVSLRMFIMLVLASQLPFLANRNAELAVPPLFWPDKCIKIGGHVALLSGPTVYTLYCGQTICPACGPVNCNTTGTLTQYKNPINGWSQVSFSEFWDEILNVKDQTAYQIEAIKK